MAIPQIGAVCEWFGGDISGTQREYSTSSKVVEILTEEPGCPIQPCRMQKIYPILRRDKLGFSKCHMSILPASPRHFLGVTVQQLLRGYQLCLAVTIPSLFARLAAAHDLGQLRGCCLVELFDCLDGWRGKL